MVSDWALLFIGWREIGFTISFNVSWAAFAIMFEDMLKDATVKEIHCDIKDNVYLCTC